MQVLHPFSDPKNKISLSADLFVRDGENIDVTFQWEDPENKIIFANEPQEGRHMGLWQQTCFEMFIQPVGKKAYYEINLTAKKAWNVFVFEDYRAPQPPQELAGAELVRFDLQNSLLKAEFFLPGANFEKVRASFCAVIVLKAAGTSYWSVKHADVKPNFHHFDSFITERATR